MTHTTIAAHNLPGAVSLSRAPTLAASAIVKDCRFGRYTQVGEQTRMENCLLDDYSYVQPYGDLMSADIGKFANIASMVRINPGFHPMEYPTLHHFTYRPTMYGMADTDEADFFAWRRRQRVVIGHDTWIGHGAVIMPGVRIGNGAVVGSNSVVTKDVPPYAIVGGVAAKVIRQRFPKAIADALDATAWWDWDHDTLTERLPDFRDIRGFLAKYASPV
ncbi:MAG: DapH/DapD/GlmU-related protein [Rhodoferax sp.]|uniref:DapH/DapD/GlmU-related protein n=1 Tax=Rhodoferax sp. TaxID=50421 RepID=UPI003018E842